ncbi:MAG: methyltransferase domain-containing protein [Nitrospiraceae bacterium]|nr:MAG: methyltransferase domain-containing protein [Nitrospiraceae bacterium]
MRFTANMKNDLLFTYANWGDVRSADFVNLISELGKLGALAGQHTSKDGAGRLQHFTLKLWETPFIAIQVQNIRSAGLRILDIGSGLSPLPAHLQSLGHSVTAVDNNAWNLWEKGAGWMKSIYRTGAEYVELSNLRDITRFDKHSFDVITSCSVIEHFDEETFRIFREVLKHAANPEGQIILTYDFDIAIWGAVSKDRDMLDIIKAGRLMENLFGEGPVSQQLIAKTMKLQNRIKLAYPLFLASRSHLFKLYRKLKKTGPMFNNLGTSLREVTSSIGISCPISCLIK